MISKSLLAAQLAAATAHATPAFKHPPVATRIGSEVSISFSVKDETDVTVDIRDTNGRVLRHLVAGVLGENAPPPLKAGTLEQEIVWDGKDNAGKPVDLDACRVRVGLGTQPRFERVIGYQPQWLGQIHAMASGPGGKLYVFSDRGISVLDHDGHYQKQIAPAPAGTPADKLKGLKPVQLADGSTFFSDEYQFPAKMKYVGSMAITPQGELLLPTPAPYQRRLARIGIDGSVPEGAFDTKLTALSDVGYLYFAVSPDGKKLYFSGAEAGYRGDDAREASYRQAVYWLNLDGDGPGEILIGEDENWGEPGAHVHHPKGLATDQEGRIYVCNYGGDVISVHTPRGGLLYTIAVKHPREVAVHPKTGKLYVLAGEELGYFQYGYNYEPTLLESRLLRLSPEGTIECSLELEAPYTREGPTRPGNSYQVRFAADFSEKKAVLWAGLASPEPSDAKWSLLRVEEEGDGFGKPRDVCPRPADALTDMAYKLMVDKTNDILYSQEGRGRLQRNQMMRFKGDGTSLGTLLLLDKNGEGEPYFFTEAAVGPDGTLWTFAWQGRWSIHSKTRLTRFSPDGKHIPFPEEKEGILLTPVTKGGRGDSSRGLAVSPSGDIYVLYYDTQRPEEGRQPWERGWELNTTVARVSPQGEMKESHLISTLRSSAQCLRVDHAGSLYVGETTMPIGVAYPRELADALPDPFKRDYVARMKDGRFDPTLRYMGSVLKFGPDGGRIIGLPEDDATKPPRRPKGDLWKPAPEVQWFLLNNQRVHMSGAEWQFHGFSPLPAEYRGIAHVEHCICRGGRFDLDEFSRVFVPDNLRHKVTVLDSAGNTVCRFGEYGNQDSAGPEINLADPWWIAAASDRVYIGDGYARRIVKVRLEPEQTEECAVTTR